MQKNKVGEFFILLLTPLALLLSIYNKWIDPTKILTRGDWPFFFSETLSTLRIDYFSFWLSDFGFGRILLDAGQAPTYSIYGFFAKYFNVPYSLTEHLFHLWPIVLITPISMYILLYNWFKSKLSLYLCITVYCFNTYFLSLQTGHLTLMSGFAFAPIALNYFIYTLKTYNLKFAIITGFTLFIISAYEPRSFIITILLIFIYFIYHLIVIKKSDFLKSIKPIFIFAAVPILLVISFNLFWIIGLSKINAIANNELFSRGLFGENFWNIRYALTLQHPWWTGSVITVFENQPIPLYFWLIPIFAFAGLWVGRKNKDVVFFGIVALIGILLSKQVDDPFPQLYPWLFENVPGFNAFREASKFYFLIALGYSVLIGSFVDWLWKWAKRDLPPLASSTSKAISPKTVKIQRPSQPTTAN